MSGSMNKVILIGNLGKDPEIRTLNSGDRVANFQIATSESWRDRTSDERKEKTEWHRVVIFNDKLAEIAEKYLKKGSKVIIEGSLQTRKWADNSGNDHYATEVVVKAFDGKLTLLGDSAASRNTPPHADSPDEYGHQKQPGTGAKQDFPFDDEVPF